MHHTPTAAGRVARTFFTLASGETSARLIAFAGTVYLARTLGPEPYGAVGFAVAVLLYLGRFADGGLELGVGVREAAGSRVALARALAPTLTIRAIIAAAVAAVTAALGLLFLPPLEGQLLAVYAIALLGIGLSTRWVHIGLGQARYVAIARTLGELTALAFLVLAVRRPGDVLRVPVSQIIGEGVVAAGLLVLVARSNLSIRPRIDFALAGPTLRSGWRLMFASLLGLAVYNSDLLFLRALHGRESTGYYAAAYLFVTCFLSLAIAYGLSLMATLRGVWHDAVRRRALYETALAHVMLLGLPVVIGVAYVAPSVVALILGPQYAPAADALRLLVWSVLPAALCEVATVALIVAGKESEVLRVYAATFGVATVLNIALIPKFGIVGAAVSTIVAEVVRLAVALRAVRQLGGMQIGVTRWWRPGVAAALMAALLVVVQPATLPAAIGLGVVSYAAGLVVTGAVRLRGAALPAVSV